VSWSSDSQRVAFSEDGPLLFNDSDIWVLELGNRQLTNLTDDGVAGSPPGLFEGTWKTPFDLVPAWSPDGQHIVFSRILNDSTALYTVPTHGGEAVKLTDLPGAAKFAVTYPIFWSQDGRQIIFSLTNPALHDPVNGVYVVDSDGRNLHRVLSTADANQMAIVTGLSASGTLALIWNSTAGIQPGSAAFDLLDLTTGKATPLARPRPGPGVPQDLGNATFSPDGSHLLMAFGGSDAKGELMIRRLDSEIEYSLGTGMDVVRLDINDYYPLQWSQSNRIFASKARGLATVYMLGQ
jgi:dipeptidyl aminopeptidase/acylaminoacyl peptidase